MDLNSSLLNFNFNAHAASSRAAVTVKVADQSNQRLCRVQATSKKQAGVDKDRACHGLRCNDHETNSIREMNTCKICEWFPAIPFTGSIWWEQCNS